MADNEKTLLLLGGYGAAGVAIAQLLLRTTNLRLIVAGRDEDRLRPPDRHLHLLPVSAA